MNNQLSRRVNAVQESASISVSDKAATLRAAGEKIINLAFGEPDFDTPEHIKRSALRALEEGQTKYTKVDGTDQLKTAILNKFRSENQLHYSERQIIVSNGAKQSIYNALCALINAGDEVLIPAPYWVSYTEAVRLVDGVPVVIGTDIDDGFKIGSAKLEQHISLKTRVLVLNSPSNPTGAIYTKSELESLAEVLARNPRIVVLSDDIYEHIRWTNDRFYNIANINEEMPQRTIVVNGVSKCYAMTGWRIGYVAGPSDIVAAMKKIQSHTTSGPNSIAQYAATAALTGDQAPMHAMVAEFKKRHDYVMERLDAISGVRCMPPEGAFYAFPQVVELMEKQGMTSDVEFSKQLLEKKKLAVVPGSAYGVNGYVRLSFATSMDNLERALDSIEEFAKGVSV